MTDHSSYSAQSMIRIDGARVKALREQQGLTQLYVASAVQVTTDTISRWENKKYPTIKKENGLKLAEALEVSLEEIIETEQEQPDQVPEKTNAATSIKAAPPSFKKIWPLLILSATIGILIVIVTLFFLYQPPQGSISATRVVPNYFTPGQPFPIAIEVNGYTGQQKAIILRENLPDQLKILSTYPPISPEASKDNQLKWISKIEGPTIFVYIASLSDQPTNEFKFDGSIAVSRQDEVEEETKGEISILASRFHWADNDGDHVISDKEILTVYDLFGGIDSLKKDIDLVEEMWLGAGYRWNDTDKSYDIIP